MPPPWTLCRRPIIEPGPSCAADPAAAACGSCRGRGPRTVRVAHRPLDGAHDAAPLRRLLKDSIYIGKAKLGGEVFPGEHDGIVPKALFQKVKDLMRENRCSGGAPARNRYGALLRGLLRCSACDAAMVHGWTR